MKDLTLEYIAGFVDGEGCFTISKHLNRKYRPFFSITNTDRQILEDIKDYFSLSLKIYIDRAKNPNQKTVYVLKVYNIVNCKSIASQLEPYLRLKKEQAQIIMQYPRSRWIRIGSLRQVDYYTRSVHQNLRKRIRLLNGRGPLMKEVS